MSGLVAYGASDDSESEASDVEVEEEKNIDTTKKKIETFLDQSKKETDTRSRSTLISDNSSKNDAKKNGDEGKNNNIIPNNLDDQISDEEDYQQTAPTSSSASSSLFTGNLRVDMNTDTDQVSTNWDLSAVSNQGQGLPAPQQKEKMEVEETELEDEVKQKPVELAEAPKPPPKRTKQPVKITIPSLSEIPDDDDEQTTEQKPVPSKVRSGLFSLLPPPIHSAKKEINRPLIPHSLGKKTPVPKPSPVAKLIPSSQVLSKTSVITSSVDSSNSKPKIFSNLSGYDDSDDDNDEDASKESNNFFSLGGGVINKSNSNKSLTSSTTTTTSKKDSSSNSKPVKTGIEIEKNNPQDSEISSTEKVEEEDEEEEEEKEEVRIEPGFVNDSPLDFGNASRFASWSSASSSSLGGVGSSRTYHPATTYNLSQNTTNANVQFNMVDADGVDQSDKCSTSTYSDPFQQMMNNKEFQKFQGKRKRGNEEINFVDANVDDYVDPSELSKHITEETEYTSTKQQKDDMPTSQQRRKKQITYLAFQAKEKEMELKNTWSQNKLTRRQTQAKYGF